MPHYQRLRGTKCYLSPPSDGDGELIKKWENDLEVLLGASMDGLSTPAAALYRAAGQLPKGLDNLFMIVDLETDNPIGWCALFCQLPANRRGSLAIIIGEKEYWGRGYGTEAVTWVLDYGFNILNLNSVELGVYVFNARAIRSYEKVGFKKIGIHRESRIMAGTKYDTLSMDILAAEFTGSAVLAAVQRGYSSR